MSANVENLSIIIPFYNGHSVIERLLSSIPKSIPVLIIDDQSDQPLILENGKYRNLKIHRSPRKGYFTGAVNLGFEMTTTDVLILNQDVWLTGKQWLSLIADKRGRFGLIGEGIAGVHPAWPAGYIHGTFMFVRRDVIERLGPMNATDYPLWGSTCEYQLRACRRGFEAFPLRPIPGLNHERQSHQRFGSAISEILEKKPGQKDWFIRTPPAISVIIPAYNHGRYLQETVNSLIGGPTSLGMQPGQTFQSFEVLIVNDNSTDNTEEIGAALADPWKAIRFISRSKNGGTGAANNTGIRNARGRYVTFLSADDMMKPERLETLYRAIVANPGRFVYDDMVRLTNGQLHENWRMRDFDFDALLVKNHIHCGIMLAKRDAIKVGLYPEQMRYGREDWAMNIRLGMNGVCGIRVRQPMYIYRRENQNRTLTNTTPAWRDRFIAQLRGLFPDLYNGVRPMACCGGRRSKVTPRNPGPTPAAMLAGAEGMELLKYVGRNYGTEVFFGPVTGAQYEFGLSKPLGLVDKADLTTGSSRRPGLLEIRESGRFVFTIEKPKPELVVSKAEAAAVIPGIQKASGVPEAELTEIETVADYERPDYVYEDEPAETIEPGEEIPEMIEPDEETGEIDVANLPVMAESTVSDISQLVASGIYTLAELRYLLNEESEGKNRVTLIKAIEKQIDLQEWEEL